MLRIRNEQGDGRINNKIAMDGWKDRRPETERKINKIQPKKKKRNEETEKQK
ncbi:hypothetical protein V6Z12_D02G000900 [Gossypium hirsutum]